MSTDMAESAVPVPAPSFRIRLKMPTRDNSAEVSPSQPTHPLPSIEPALPASSLALAPPPLPPPASQAARVRAPRRSAAGAVSYTEPPLDEFNDDTNVVTKRRSRPSAAATELNAAGAFLPRESFLDGAAAAQSADLSGEDGAKRRRLSTEPHRPPAHPMPIPPVRAALRSGSVGTTDFSAGR
jgi:hypothetical protein